MKFNYKIFIFLGVTVLSMGSCKKYFGDINTNPDSNTSAPPSTVLPSVETTLNYTIGGDISRFASIFDQQTTGNNRQFAGYNMYQFANGDYNTIWDNLYFSITNLKAIETFSAGKNANAYYGIAKILEANALMNATDFFGDVPYSDAFQGNKQLQPKYDAQADVYTSIFSLLTDGRTKLALAVGAPAPGGDDLVYGGSTAKWTKFANALAARGYLHLAKVDKGNYAKALVELAKGAFASSADDARFPYLSTDIGAAPWYEYIRDRGDTENGIPYIALLKSLGDPRLSTYGAPYIDAAGKNIQPILKANQPYPYMTFTEQKFIEAEAKLQTGDAAGATLAYLAGIKSSILEAGNTAADYTGYIANTKVVPPTGITLNEIITQKYIALWTQPEAYLDWRRTGIPALTPNIGTSIPRRFLYPLSEVEYNTNVPKGVLQFDRVWLDK